MQPNDRAALEKEENYRLLVDPCRDNPADYFEYIEEHPDSGAIKAKEGLQGFEAKKAQESIRVFALHRIDLFKARSRHLDIIYEIIDSIKYAVNQFNKAANRTERKEHEDFIKRKCDVLINYADEDKEFSALSNQVIRKFLPTLSVDIRNAIGL
jgi:hypothetical protein